MDKITEDKILLVLDAIEKGKRIHIKPKFQNERVIEAYLMLTISKIEEDDFLADIMTVEDQQRFIAAAHFIKLYERLYIGPQVTYEKIEGWDLVIEI